MRKKKNSWVDIIAVKTKIKLKQAGLESRHISRQRM